VEGKSRGGYTGWNGIAECGRGGLRGVAAIGDVVVEGLRPWAAGARSKARRRQERTWLGGGVIDSVESVCVVDKRRMHDSSTECREDGDGRMRRVN
jgi:hypothetical protein